jgi:hypothetical protein
MLGSTSNTLNGMKHKEIPDIVGGDNQDNTENKGEDKDIKKLNKSMKNLTLKELKDKYH